jgi:hypothetical protein
LLIPDGHGSHLTFEFIQYCMTHKILLLIYPPHSTHSLQPLDVVMFKPLSSQYSAVSHLGSRRILRVTCELSEPSIHSRQRIAAGRQRFVYHYRTIHIISIYYSFLAILFEGVLTSAKLTTFIHKSMGLLNLKKGDFFGLFWAAWIASFKKETILKSFEACRI